MADELGRQPDVLERGGTIPKVLGACDVPGQHDLLPHVVSLVPRRGVELERRGVVGEELQTPGCADVTAVQCTAAGKKP